MIRSKQVPKKLRKTLVEMTTLLLTGAKIVTFWEQY